MELYLVRHGIATERTATETTPDADRELTPDGIRKVRRNARALHRLGVELDAVWTSPLKRARQTAELLAAELGVSSRLTALDALQPSGSFDAVVAELRLHADLRGVGLVGHEPYLGEFASYLLTGSRAAEIEFKKGGVAYMVIDDFDDPVRAGLRWLLTPRQMARMTGK
jgi:phosphohistidine phosphatase